MSARFDPREGLDNDPVVVEDLWVSYDGHDAVRGVSFTARAGEVTVVLGPNGAGKTSTIEVCEGFSSATSGRVRVLDLDPAESQRELSRRMGVMLQEGGIYPGAKVGETLRQYCDLYDRGVNPTELLATVGLEGKADRTWKRLSGGEKQRLSLGLALAARPEVAFLDEPTSGVDLNGRDSIRAVVTNLAAQGCAVVLATHELDEAERMADRVLIFDHGQIVADGSLADLRSAHERIQFRCSENIDMLAMGEVIGHVVVEREARCYSISAAPTPRLIAQITSWLAERDHQLEEIAGGAERLEDVFRRLTAEGGEPQ